ncbi:MAG: type II toxin-antitoxin system VapC family toxin [Spirochaetales bacterium]
MKVLLDTSVYSQPLKKRPLDSVVSRWRMRPESDYAISAMVELEVLYGLHLKNSPPLFAFWEKLLKGRLPVLAFDNECAAVYARLQAGFSAAGFTKPQFDLMIASTALRHGLILATCNATDFAGIPGLVVEDWSTAGF